jgi:hypothetical protein
MDAYCAASSSIISISAIPKMLTIAAREKSNILEIMKKRCWVMEDNSLVVQNKFNEIETPMLPIIHLPDPHMRGDDGSEVGNYCGAALQNENFVVCRAAYSCLYALSSPRRRGSPNCYNVSNK